jgi:hypothetical protein
MDNNSSTYRAHSADVRMQLCLNGHILPIAQLGRDFLILKDPIDHPPADAKIYMSIDGVKSRWPVRLTDGVSAERVRTRIASAGGGNGKNFVDY